MSNGTKECYLYDNNGVYICPTESWESPLEPGVFPLPANCTWTAPPDLSEKQAAVWDGQAWSVVADHRPHLENGEYVGGDKYWLAEDAWDSEGRYYMQVGDFPEGALLQAPEKPLKTTYEEEIRDLESMLSDTDYVVTKIAEASALGEDTSALTAEYADVIAKRKEARSRINELEELIEAIDSPTEETEEETSMDENPSSEVDGNSGEEVN